MTLPQILVATKISKGFGRTQVLSGVELQIAPAECVAITGDNGSGKSTLLRALSGQLHLSSGTIHIASTRLFVDQAEAKRHLAYVPDTSEAFAELRASEFVQLALSLRGLKSTSQQQQIASDFDLDSFAGRKMSALSFGQRKRTWLTAALCGPPKLLILDEPSNGLDPAAVTTLVKHLQERKRTGSATLLSSNDPEFLSRLSATHYRLAEGRLQRRP